MKERNAYFDVLRAIAIILVVANHTTPVVVGGAIVTLRFVKINVPLFLAISGFFIGGKSINCRNDYFSFLKKQLPRVYIPLLLFSLPYIFKNGINLHSIVGRTVMSVMGVAMYPYYFVFLIAQLYLLLPLYQKNDKKTLWLSCLLSFATVGVVTYYNGYKSADLPLYLFAGLFPLLNIFFAQGCYYNKNGRTYSIKPLMWILPLTLALSCVEDWFWRTYYTSCGMTVTAFMFILPAIKLLFSEKVELLCNRYKNTWLYCGFAKIGRVSFTVFLLHVYIIQLLSSNHLFTGIWFVNVFLVVFVTTAIVLLLEKLLPYHLHRYIGL